APAIDRREIDDAGATEAHEDRLVAVELHRRAEGIAHRARDKAADEALLPAGGFHRPGRAGGGRAQLRLVLHDEALLAPVRERPAARLAHPAHRLLAAEAAVAQQQAGDE